jgi:hypothetical protein
MLIAQKVPRQVCSIRNARMSRCPAIFLSSCKDQTVPIVYQERILREYGGPFRLLRLEDADHATSLNLSEQREYGQHLQWLRDEAISTIDLGSSRALETASAM